MVHFDNMLENANWYPSMVERKEALDVAVREMVRMCKLFGVQVEYDMSTNVMRVGNRSESSDAHVVFKSDEENVMFAFTDSEEVKEEATKTKRGNNKHSE